MLQVVSHKRSPSGISSVYNNNVTPRRIQQLVRAYKKGGVMPELDRKRRPWRTSLTEEEQKRRIDYTLSRRNFELKKRDFCVPKNKMYAYMNQSRGWTNPDPKKQKKRKRCRYERKHSVSLIHGDFHRTNENHKHCIVWLDDASRRILAGGEFGQELEIHGIQTLKCAITIMIIKEGGKLECPDLCTD